MPATLQTLKNTLLNKLNTLKSFDMKSHEAIPKEPFASEEGNNGEEEIKLMFPAVKG